ncbi:hypothetical protein [Nocardia sp. MW-W600-9]
MDRPDAHRPIGARQHDPGSAGGPFTAAVPWRPGRDLGAPRPRRLTEPTDPQPRTGARHRVEGGPTTPAGIPVISLSAAHVAPDRSSGRIVPTDSYATDRLPIVGGPFDPGARHALPEAPQPMPEPDNGPATDRLPIITPDTPAPDRVEPEWVAATPVSLPPRPAPDYGGDDEVFARMIDRSRRKRVPRWVGPLAASVAGAVLIGGGYLQLRGPVPESAAASSPIAPAPAGATPVAGNCPAELVGSKIQGNGAGGTDSGVAAILAFQYAYYVARSGDQARTLVSGDAALPSGADIQEGIDTIPVGTTHCLSITPAAFAGQYFVVITEFRPDAVPIIYNPQLVGTAKVGNKYLITSIGPVR